MKCNAYELAQLSDKPCVIEGRLNYKKISNGSYRNQAVFKERWFRLINNYLFYFKISEMGKFDTRSPAGVFIMENSSIQMEHGQSIPFSFSISFIDEPEKRHVFAARSEDNVVSWVMNLRQCSYEYLRNRLHTLQSKVYSITGKDPLLMVPRNDGACLWAPSVPFSTTPACTVNTSSFSCHLHANSSFTLERSKSDVQAYQHEAEKHKKNTTFYATVQKEQSENIEGSRQGFSLERSQTSAFFSHSQNVLDTTIFDNRPLYSRAAPSPPARTKLTNTRRPEHSAEILTEKNREVLTTGILESTPVPPRRKVSPKPLGVQGQTSSKSTQDINDDLIQF